MARVLIRGRNLAVVGAEVPFPPPPDWFDLNPLGRAPVLRHGPEAVFPTLLVLERPWTMAGHPDGAYRPGTDRQSLLVTLQAGDALVAALYQDRTGLRPAAPNHIGYDPAQRNLERFTRTLGWLAARPQVGRDEVNLPDVAMACLIQWSEARGGPGPPPGAGLDGRIRALARRPGFADTQPRPWRPGERQRPSHPSPPRCARSAASARSASARAASVASAATAIRSSSASRSARKRSWAAEGLWTEPSSRRTRS